MNEEGCHEEPKGSGIPNMLAGPLGDEPIASEGMLSY